MSKDPTWFGPNGDPVVAKNATSASRTTGAAAQNPLGPTIPEDPSFRQVLLRRLLKGVFTEPILEGIDRGRLRTIILRVASQDLAYALQAPVDELVPEALLLVSVEPDKYNKSGNASQLALETGKPVICISQAVDRFVPKSVVAAADKSIAVPSPSGRLFEDALREFVGKAVPARARHLHIEALSINEICACVAQDRSVRLILNRLERAIASKSDPATDGSIPELIDASGYGFAREWALSLKQDLDDFRAGRIDWSDVDHGCLLVGPPGTGKTLFARIVASACGVPFIASSVAEFLGTSTGYLDGVIKAQRAVFERAAAQAPAILFVDELDALPAREGLSPRGKDWWTPIITDFLLLLDGAMSNRQGVVVIGATNRPDDIDKAILREGRLERSIVIGPPSPPELAKVLRFYLNQDLPGADLEFLCRKRPGATGADAMAWARAARRAARRRGEPMSWEDLASQIISPDLRNEHLLRRIAAHEAGHACSGLLLGIDVLERVSIERFGDTGGGFTSWRPSQHELITREHLEHRVMVLLSGRATEQLLTDDIPSASAGGPGSSDLAIATNLVAMWRTSLGLGDDLVWRGPPDTACTLAAMDASLRAMVENDLRALMARTRELISSNLAVYRAVAEALLQARELDGEQVRAIFERQRDSAATPVVDGGGTS